MMCRNAIFTNGKLQYAGQDWKLYYHGILDWKLSYVQILHLTSSLNLEKKNSAGVSGDSVKKLWKLTPLLF